MELALDRVFEWVELDVVEKFENVAMSETSP